MPALATSFESVRGAIGRFTDEVRRNPQLRDRLAYARAWYACQAEDGQWQFGPSKFIGYEGLTAETYLEESDRGLLDGRRTEAQLKQWFKPLASSTAHHEQLSVALSAFLAEHNKAPSLKMRLNVPREARTDDHSRRSAALLDLIAVVAESLQPSELDALRKRLAAIG